jgi:outer membrane protein assembly factor BamB
MFNQRFLAALLLTIALVPSVATADWPRWRGSSDHGSVDVGEYPTELGDQSLVWKADLPGKGFSTPAVVTPVIVNDVAVIAYGRNDKGAPRLHGVRQKGSGDVTATNHVWMRDDMSTFVPTPAAYKGLVYLVRDRGEVECIDPATGKTIWSDALPKHRNSYYASPTIAAGNLYAPREDGVVFVASVDDGKFRLLSESDLKEPVIGSPVPIENRIFIRGEKHLFCFEAPAATN